MMVVSSAPGRPGPGGGQPAATSQRILHFLRQRPGLTIRNLADLVGCSHTTASYHLTVLCRSGEVVRKRNGREVLHYIREGAHAHPSAKPSAAEYLEGLMRDERKRRIILFLDSNPVQTMTLNRIAQTLREPYGYLKRTLEHLQEAGLVVLEQRVTRFTLRTTPEFPRLLGLASARSAPLAVVVVTEPELVQGEPTPISVHYAP